MLNTHLTDFMYSSYNVWALKKVKQFLFIKLLIEMILVIHKWSDQKVLGSELINNWDTHEIRACDFNE